MPQLFERFRRLGNPPIMKSDIQRYISDELTHFVGRGQASNEQYRLLVKILKDGWITHPPHNPNIIGNLRVNATAKISQNEMYLPQMICFCDIPISDLSIHMKKYSPFGISFSKDFIVSAGGCPVFYVPRGAVVSSNHDFPPDFYKSWEKILKVEDTQVLFDENTKEKYFDWIVQEYNKMFSTHNPVFDQVGPEIIHFLDFHIFSYIKFFDHSLPDEHDDNYYFEREWRIIGHLKFSFEDVRRIVIPEACARDFRKDCPEYYGQLSFA